MCHTNDCEYVTKYLLSGDEDTCTCGAVQQLAYDEGADIDDGLTDDEK